MHIIETSITDLKSLRAVIAILKEQDYERIKMYGIVLPSELYYRVRDQWHLEPRRNSGTLWHIDGIRIYITWSMW